VEARRYDYLSQARWGLFGLERN
jgi:hypothetical protein